MSTLKKCPFCGGPVADNVDFDNECGQYGSGWCCASERYDTRPTESALLAALKAVQWSDSRGRCPSCGRRGHIASGGGEHHESCQLNAAIQLAGG